MPKLRVSPPLRQDGTNDDAGFTVLEALVAFVLFAVVTTSSIYAIVNATKRSDNTRERVDEAELADDDEMGDADFGFLLGEAELMTDRTVAVDVCA